MAQIITTDSAVLKQRLLEVSDHVHAFPEELDAMMQGNYLSCNPDNLTLMIEFPVLQWEANYQGILHGGIISTMLDHTAGVMVLCFLGCWGPTIDLNVHFIRSAKVGQVLVSTAKIIHAGRRIVQMQVSLSDKETGRTIATASAVYLNNQEVSPL